MSLEEFGWSNRYERLYRDFLQHQDTSRGEVPEPGRVLLAHGRELTLWSAGGEVRATAAGRLRHGTSAGAEVVEGLPAVGDWVLFRPGDGVRGALAMVILPRRSRISRKVAGRRAEEQVVAANVDVALVVMGLDGDYSPRRVERFLAMIWESGAEPVVVLNKADLEDEPELRLREIAAVAPGVEVHLVSAATGQGLEALEDGLTPGRTMALLGSSGAGKSTLANRLAGEELFATSAVRAGDDRGRHTTTHRQLFRLAGGALLIDNPGIREVQPWLATEGLDGAFREIAELAEHCRFRDCTHEGEPGCAVVRAVEEENLDSARLANYRGLQKEMRYLALRDDEAAMRREKRRVTAIHKAVQRQKPRW